MNKLVYIVVLITLFAEQTDVTHGECNDGELQKYVYCSSTKYFSEVVSCRVQGIAMIRNIAIDQQNHTLTCTFTIV